MNWVWLRAKTVRLVRWPISIEAFPDLQPNTRLESGLAQQRWLAFHFMILLSVETLYVSGSEDSASYTSCAFGAVFRKAKRQGVPNFLQRENCCISAKLLHHLQCPSYEKAPWPLLLCQPPSYFSSGVRPVSREERKD